MKSVVALQGQLLEEHTAQTHLPGAAICQSCRPGVRHRKSPAMAVVLVIVPLSWRSLAEKATFAWIPRTIQRLAFLGRAKEICGTASGQAHCVALSKTCGLLDSGFPELVVPEAELTY